MKTDEVLEALARERSRSQTAVEALGPRASTAFVTEDGGWTAKDALAYLIHYAGQIAFGLGARLQPAYVVGVTERLTGQEWNDRAVAFWRDEPLDRRLGLMCPRDRTAQGRGTLMAVAISADGSTLASLMLAQDYIDVGTDAVGPQIVIAVLVVLQLCVFLFALIDAVRRPPSVWRAAGSNKILWIVVIVVFQVLGSVAYLAGVRGRLKAAAGP